MVCTGEVGRCARPTPNGRCTQAGKRLRVRGSSRLNSHRLRRLSSRPLSPAQRLKLLSGHRSGCDDLNLGSGRSRVGRGAPADWAVDRSWNAVQSAFVWWISRPPALALLAATGLLLSGAFPPATVSGQVPNGPGTSPALTLDLNPQRIAITIKGDFELSIRPTSFDRAVKHIQDQIENRREVELDKASTLGAFWRARFWDYWPKSSGGSLNSPLADVDKDSFIIPSYLLLQNRILTPSAPRSRLLRRQRRCLRGSQGRLEKPYTASMVSHRRTGRMVYRGKKRTPPPR